MSAPPKRADLSSMSPSSCADRIRSSCLKEDAQTMAEYAVVFAVITPIVVLAFALLSDAIIPVFNTVRGYF